METKIRGLVFNQMGEGMRELFKRAIVAEEVWEAVRS